MRLSMKSTAALTSKEGRTIADMVGVDLANCWKSLDLELMAVPHPLSIAVNPPKQ